MSSEIEEIPCPIAWGGREIWGPAPIETIDRVLRFRPHFKPGWIAVLKSLSLRARNTSLTPPAYDPLIAPEWWAGFLDDQDDQILGGAQNTAGSALPAGLIQPIRSEPEFFELAGVFALVTLTNGGVGFDFPQPSAGIHAPLMVYARGIGTTCEVSVTPTIVYRRRS